MLCYIDHPFFHWESPPVENKYVPISYGGFGAVLKRKEKEQSDVIKTFFDMNHNYYKSILQEASMQKLLENQKTCKVKGFTILDFEKVKLGITKKAIRKIGIKMENLETEIKKGWKNGIYPLIRCFETIHSNRKFGYKDLSDNNWKGILFDFGGARTDTTQTEVVTDFFAVNDDGVKNQIIKKPQHFDRFSIVLMIGVYMNYDKEKIKKQKYHGITKYSPNCAVSQRYKEYDENDDEALIFRNTSRVSKFWLSIAHMAAVYEASLIDNVSYKQSHVGENSHKQSNLIVDVDDSHHFTIKNIREYNSKDSDNYGISRGLLRGARLEWYPQTLFERIRMDANATMGLGGILASGYSVKPSEDGFYMPKDGGKINLKADRIAAFTLFRHAARLQAISGAIKVNKATMRAARLGSDDYEAMIEAGEEMEGALNFKMASDLYTKASIFRGGKNDKAAKDRLALLELKKALLSSPNAADVPIDNIPRDSFHWELFCVYILGKEMEMPLTRAEFPSMFVEKDKPPKEDWIKSVFSLYTPVFCRDFIFLYEPVCIYN